MLRYQEIVDLLRALRHLYLKIRLVACAQRVRLERTPLASGAILI